MYMSNESNEKMKELSPVDILAKLTGDEYVWEDIVLPSKGMYYGNNWSKTAIPEGKIAVRPWTAEEEKILRTPRLLQSGQAFKMIFKRACKFPEGFDVDELLIGDRAYLMLYFRGISYGNNYEFQLTCTRESCQRTSPFEYDLNGLAQSIVWADEMKSPTEPFEMVLPDATKKLGQPVRAKFRLTRQYDIHNIDVQKSAKQGSKNDVDDSLTIQLTQNIVEIAGISDKFKIGQIVNKLSAKDASILQKAIQDLTPGVDPQISVDCPHCGNHMEVGLPITESFFRFTGE